VNLKANIGGGNLIPMSLWNRSPKYELDGVMILIKYMPVWFELKQNFRQSGVFLLKEKTQYNFDAGKNLLSEEDKTVFGVTDNDFRVIHFQLVSTGIITVYLGEGV
jgi:hypothetical protein